jgi:hypothetical protein
MRAPLAGALLATAVLVACKGSDPTSPPATTPNPTQTTISAAASAYLKQALDWEDEVFYYHDKISWSTLRADVVKQAGAAQKPADTYKAIDYSIEHYFRPLGDKHSAFFPPSESPGLVDNPPGDPRYQILGSMLDSKIAYMTVPSFAGKSISGHTDSSLTQVQLLDAAKPCGWVVDLRANYGGYAGSMLLGLAPLLQKGSFGGMQFNDNSQVLFYVDNGEMGYIDVSDNNKHYIDTRYTRQVNLTKPNSPVAILQSAYTASAGELILLAFRGSSVPVKTFGSPSYGLTTSPFGTYLQPDSAYLNITGAIWFDRTGKLLGSAVAPDSLIPQSTTFADYTSIVSRHDPKTDPALAAAQAWLLSRPECTGSGISASRAPLPGAGRATVTLPSAPAPRTKPFVPPKFYKQISASSLN